jgi:hypothetical protein
MPRAREVKETALAVITFLVRPSIFLIIGLIAGYTIGFTDAFRDSDTIGNKAARAIYRIHPEAVSAGIYERASTIRDTLHKRTGITEPDTTIPPSDIPPY